ncbi:MAG: hypothetical protein IJ111_11225 [Eggerthellaceae bacterium]|nr:hypothetical protein [Eggerthellaceae bacterium]
MDRTRLYDILYALAAEGGREAALFGDCGPTAREAFARSLAGGGFPELWFELPLAGDPWMDFHSLTSYQDVAGTQAAFAGHDGAYADALAWFAEQEPGKVRQLALSYDTHVRDVEHPAVQLLVNGPDPSVPLAFLEAAGRPDLRDSYSGFTRSMPQEWYACYTGVFPGRDAADADPWVRVECIVGDKCQKAYAEDASTLQEHLRQIGLDSISKDAIPGIQELARSPFPLEFQFNVGPGGMALPALSASVRFQPNDWADMGRSVEIGRLAGWLQSLGLADGRCGLLPQTVFAKRVDRDGESATVSCFPAFVKLRWREGQAPDAKTYLMARSGR